MTSWISFFLVFLNLCWHFDRSLKFFSLHLVQDELSKLRRITRPHLAIPQKLAALGIICVWTYEKVVRVTRLEPESNSYNEPVCNPFVCGNQVTTKYDLSPVSSPILPCCKYDRVHLTQNRPRSINFMTQLRLQSFGICLNGEPRVGTPLRRNLELSWNSFVCSCSRL